MVDATVVCDGYTLVSEDDRSIVLGVSFSEMSTDAPDEVVFRATRYLRGSIEVIPLHLASHFCSMRRYWKQSA
jgi:hypothetical protein